MFGGTRSYIIFSYLKYILTNLIIFVGIIWLSQILRILELQNSISTQLIEIIKTTILVLPSFINPLLPFLLIISCFFINYKLNISNEIIILKQYQSSKNNFIISLILTIIILFLYFINNEYLSVSLYHKYKVKELEIRNNIKLGVPSSNEFIIEDEVSIFFERQKKNKFFNVEAIIFNNGQFIKSNTAEIEIENKSYNLIFNYGERVILNENEKSKTNFDKFVYSIKNNEIEILMMDKEHFNTLELLKNTEKEFYFHGHNRIYQYILTFVIIILSFKIFFFYLSKKNIFIYYFYIFMSLLILQVINSYLIFLLNNKLDFFLYYYYSINLLSLAIFSYIILKFNEIN